MLDNDSDQARNQEALSAYTRALDDLREMQAKHHAETRRSFAEVHQGIAEINTLLRALIDKA
ncbi:hypothetical protein AORI_6964 [Amycolatopsis keratiniphila]|uniref:Uncharacterized protein n=2 Tax=Amycolatopsis keratiniphila TaxID=129921 RepID=R4TBB9_9PSEU|nr:hypothetical protein AORI_6964 [Amycolatopsis keratiniphila]